MLGERAMCRGNSGAANVLPDERRRLNIDIIRMDRALLYSLRKRLRSFLGKRESSIFTREIDYKSAF